MSAEAYAITDIGYRAIAPGATLAPGETEVSAIPAGLLVKIKAEKMKSERSQRLRATDWTQMADAPLTAAERLAYSVYREALRDLPDHPDFPNCPWPAEPAREGAAGGVGPVPMPAG